MTRLVCKDGVRFGGFSLALLRILLALDSVAAQQIPGVPAVLTLTSGSDGQHAVDSAHYRFEAVDVRTKDFASAQAKHAFTDIIRDVLGRAYFVDLEHEGHVNEHLHVQLRRGRRATAPRTA